MNAEGIFPSHDYSVPLTADGKTQTCGQKDVFSASSFDPLCPHPWLGTMRTSCFKVFTEKLTNTEAKERCFQAGAEIFQMYGNQQLRNAKRFLEKDSRFFTPNSGTTLLHTGVYLDTEKKWFYHQNGLKR